MLLVDAFSSSEAIGMGSSVSSGELGRPHRPVHPRTRGAGASTPTARTSSPVAGQSGVLALGGRIPLGYYKDEAKTAATFRTIDGIRYSVPGDYAEVGEDGSIHLLGRGSVCINTGGEKVYPEEVEEAIKTVDGVADAVVVGIPDERFGEEIVAVVELAPGTDPDSVTPETIIDHVKAETGRVQGAAAGPLRRPPSGAPPRARSTMPVTEPKPSSGPECPRADRPPPAGVPTAGQPLLAPWVRTKSLTV